MIQYSVRLPVSILVDHKPCWQSAIQRCGRKTINSGVFVASERRGPGSVEKSQIVVHDLDRHGDDSAEADHPVIVQFARCFLRFGNSDLRCVNGQYVGQGGLVQKRSRAARRRLALLFIAQESVSALTIAQRMSISKLTRRDSRRIPAGRGWQTCNRRSIVGMRIAI